MLALYEIGKMNGNIFFSHCKLIHVILSNDKLSPQSEINKIRTWDKIVTIIVYIQHTR